MAALLTTAVVFGTTGCGLQVTENRMRIMLQRAVASGQGYPDLDAAIFGPKTIFTGVINADRFNNVIGFWLFLLEPHRPETTPVVFVHGHSTGPRPMAELMSSLDRERFEPWVTYYPTGLPIARSGALFRRNLERMAQRYETEEVIIVAYSMGGLVARQALRPYADGVRLPSVRRFISVSNPWNGSEESRFESERPFAPGSWDDVQDGSPFLETLFSDPLPEGTEFHYIYGLGGEPDETLGPENDGILSGASLARPEALAEATSVTLFRDAQHVSIISDPRTLERIGALLAEL